LIGYGELIIVKHNSTLLSAYGHNRRRLVKEGDKVKSGQQIAEMGSSSATRDMLHFEIRRNGKPVDPQRICRRSEAVIPRKRNPVFVLPVAMH
jgi:lipoprotein NlpD